MCLRVTLLDQTSNLNKKKLNIMRGLERNKKCILNIIRYNKVVGNVVMIAYCEDQLFNSIKHFKKNNDKLLHYLYLRQ